MTMNSEIFLDIKISSGDNDGSGCSIHWEDSPEIGEEWDDEDQAWTKICNGIHALLANLEPWPETGYKVVFRCKDYKKLVGKND